MTKTAEQVLAKVAEMTHRIPQPPPYHALEELTAPYLPKPAPDRLTLAARECYEAAKAWHYPDMQIAAIRAIIAREVAAAEPSDEAIGRVVTMLYDKDTPWCFGGIRSALKGEGA